MPDARIDLAIPGRSGSCFRPWLQHWRSQCHPRNVRRVKSRVGRPGGWHWLCQCVSAAGPQSHSPRRVPPRMGTSPALLAGALGSAGRNATLVTLSTRPVISAAVLLDLARWCQQRLAFTEDGTPCGDPQIDLKHPPFCASTHEGQETGHSQLATTGRLHAPRPSSAPGDDDRASRSKLARGRRKGGTR